ncbi:hypothetical protein NPIL_339491 [Nephila pilipes]|uniref:Uncharacterized protein n=1 Tax=Nephila pilipes TaxID=299642 RepID=A0A8X6PBL5_NEPPI|nr:hypothetical protein NPIL_339491 [Nephila pilipes]
MAQLFGLGIEEIGQLTIKLEPSFKSADDRCQLNSYRRLAEEWFHSVASLCDIAGEHDEGKQRSTDKGINGCLLYSGMRYKYSLQKRKVIGVD